MSLLGHYFRAPSKAAAQAALGDSCLQQPRQDAANLTNYLLKQPRQDAANLITYLLIKGHRYPPSGGTGPQNDSIQQQLSKAQQLKAAR